MIQFLDCDFEPAFFQRPPGGCGGDTFSNRTDNPTREENVFCWHGSSGLIIQDNKAAEGGPMNRRLPPDGANLINLRRINLFRKHSLSAVLSAITILPMVWN
jgi:hypothetical protein